MPYRLEISLKSHLSDAEGEGIRNKAKRYLGIDLVTVRTVNILTMDIESDKNRLEQIRSNIFTNPVTQISSYETLDIPFDWCIWVGFRPGVKDNQGNTAVEAIEDFLKLRLKEGEAVYTSKRYCICKQGLSYDDVSRIAKELLANDIIQQWKIFSRNDWPKDGIGMIIPKVRLDRTPTVTTISIDSDESLKQISEQRNLALNPRDIPTIRSYFLRPEVIAKRREFGLQEPTDIELEYISQGRSDHCNHNTFRGLFRYCDMETGKQEIINNPFKTMIEEPTLALQKQKDWVVSVLWDNAGVGRLNEDYFYVITGETHNSPSNMEAYGGAITGIVGVYRDPLGTGKGSKLLMGAYGFCVGHRDYDGELAPKLHPRRLLDGVIEGVRDGGNKSGIPTPFGQVTFHTGYMGKCLVFVTAVGVMPSKVDGKQSDQKTTSDKELIFMCGGRVGKDGIHGVTASSEVFSENTPAGHVQIGDPYTQKKMHDFLIEARDQGFIAFITDNGGGGLSSSIGESARYSNGCFVELDKVPLKYQGMDQWEIWVSESQERMTVSVRPEHAEKFLTLSKKHAVESTQIGHFTSTGKLHLAYKGKTCAYVDMDLLTKGFPQWEFEAQWRSPEMRGLYEPVITPPKDYNALIKDILARPNICSKEWIIRQYDHEVQGTSVIKPLIGVDRDTVSDAVVIRPVLNLDLGLAYAQAIIPMYSAIDAYHMTSCTIDEAVRRVVAVGGNPDHIGGVDNFCWPNIQYDAVSNPDGKYKAAQLVRSCKALKELVLAYGIPLLSGKDSMYVDGYLKGPYGETRKVSALETIQFTTISLVENVETCVTMEAKNQGDLVYVLGLTRNEAGGSEYYERLGYVGLNVPKVYPEIFSKMYRSLAKAIGKGQVASVHGVYRGGLAVHLALVAIGGGIGMEILSNQIPTDKNLRDDVLLFSESAGRFIVTINRKMKQAFENEIQGNPFACIGTTGGNNLSIIAKDGKPCADIPVIELKTAWKKTFGNLI